MGPTELSYGLSAGTSGSWRLCTAFRVVVFAGRRTERGLSRGSASGDGDGGRVDDDSYGLFALGSASAEALTLGTVVWAAPRSAAVAVDGGLGLFTDLGDSAEAPGTWALARVSFRRRRPRRRRQLWAVRARERFRGSAHGRDGRVGSTEIACRHCGRWPRAVHRPRRLRGSAGNGDSSLR
jgi:hypothetical protein